MSGTLFAANLAIPPLLTPSVQPDLKTFTLNAGPGQVQIAPGLPASQTMGYNGAWLGPTIRVSQGDTVHMVVNNNLAESTTVHWHGMHVPAAADGGIEQTILPGRSWTPTFQIRQAASTNWYHPHMMGVTARQVEMGLAGMFIVDDGSAAEAALPQQYGVDDIPLIFQSLVVDSTGKIVYDESKMQNNGNTFPLLLNGANVAASLPVFNATRSRVRFRILNASVGDILTLSFTDGRAFNEIATDGGFLPSPLNATSVRVGPAERVELIVDLAQSRTLQATIEPALITGGSGTVPVLQINPQDTTAQPPLPSVLNTITPINTAGAGTHIFNFSYNPPPSNIFAGFGINGISGTSMSQVMDPNNTPHVAVGTNEVWTVTNNTPQTHFFHMHDESFQVVSKNGATPSGDQVGWKDTVEVPPGTTAQLAIHFADYTDSNNAYMLHCHLEPHEDEGMMALFYVDPVLKNHQGRLTYDFAGTGKSDLVIWRPEDGGWYLYPFRAPVVQWGMPGDVAVAGDFDGDKKYDYAVWRPATGTWWIVPSSNPGAPYGVQWGLPGDIPLAGDFDGDGKSDLVIFRPADGNWYILPSSNPNAPYAQHWGANGDIPLISDFDSDGKLDLTVYRPSNGTWYILPSSNPTIPISQRWGTNGDIPLIADFDGDGKNDYTVFRPWEGAWYIIPSSNPAATVRQQWGVPGDIPLVTDTDGDGKTDYTVYRPANGMWYTIPSSSPGSPQVTNWGISTDTPL